MSEKENIEIVEEVTEVTEEAKPYKLRSLKDKDFYPMLDIVTATLPDDMADIFQQLVTGDKTLDEIGGMAVYKLAVPISKKIVTIQNGIEAIAYETNVANARASASGGSGGFGGTDTVESQGTTGGWSWRKWSSGIAECWCSKEITNMPCSTAVGSWYRTAEIKHGEYPFTFAETPLINMFFETASGTGGLVWSAGMSDVADDKQQAHQFYIIRMAASDGITGKVHTFVRGKYK